MYVINRYQIVVRSVMAREVHELVLGFYYAMILLHLVSQLPARSVTLEAFVDSNTLFDVIGKDARTTEGRLSIDISALRESYETGELGKVGWIPVRDNPSDGLTKQTLGLHSPFK